MPDAPVMLILPGIASSGGQSDPHGLLDRPSAVEFARLCGYEGRVLNIPGATGAATQQTLAALHMIRDDPSIRAIYGFSGGGYNAKHIWHALHPEERARIDKIVVVGAPAQPGDFLGCTDVVLRGNPEPGQGHHMDGPRILLEDFFGEE